MQQSARGVKLAAPPVLLDQDVVFAADPGRQLGRERGLAGRAQPRRALLASGSGRRGMPERGLPGRALYGNT